MNKNTPYHHFVLFGSQITDQANVAYQYILQKLSSKYKSVNFHLASPTNFEKLILEIKDAAIFCPLFLMKGIEYNKVETKLKDIFPFEKNILKPISHYEAFLKKVFKGDTNTVFLMHGSTKYDNFQKHSHIISFGKNLGYQHFCFLEGNPSFQDVITNLLSKYDKTKISPLLFFTNNHIKNDVVANFLSTYENKRWTLEMGLLERQDTLNAIIEIIDAEIGSITK